MTAVIDEQWIDDYRQISSYPGEIDRELRAEGLNEKFDAFIASDFSVNPDLRPDIDLAKVDSHQESILRLRDNITSREKDLIVVDAYVPRLSELLRNLKMLRAAATGDVDSYIEANIEQFGEPDKDTFYDSIAFIEDMAVQAIIDPRVGVRERAKKVIDLLPDIDEQVRNTIEEEAFNKVKDIYDDLFKEIGDDIVDLPQTISGDLALSTAQHIVDRLGFDYTVVPQREGLSTMSVNHPKKEVKIPADEVYALERFLGLMAHEVYIHILERINGDKQPLKILYSGLDKYLRAGEGKGVAAEMVAYGSISEFMNTKRAVDIMRRHLAIGLARGLGDGQLKDFKEVFAVMNAIDDMLEIINASDDPEMASKIAEKRTWELLTMRTQKGVVGRGAAAHKDKIYKENRGPQMNLLAKNPHIFPYLNLGKYDLTNASHISVLERAGIIPHNMIGSSYE